MKQDTVMGFSWEFIDEMTVWSVVLGTLAALVGGYLLGSTAFAVGCLIALAIDLALVRVSTHRARSELAEGRVDSVAPTVMLAGRLVAKAIILVIALFVPAEYGFAGTVIGAVTFDITLLVVGSIVAARRTMGHQGKGGEA